MKVNPDAPIFVRREITVFAPPEKVWDWLSRVELWGDWNPEIASSYWLQDEDRYRKRFRWRRGLFRITSEMSTWNEQREIAWIGHVYSATLRQVFRLKGDFRQTHIVSEQSVEGPPVSIMRPLIRRFAERSSETWLAVLKTRLESIHERGTRRREPPRPPSLPSSRMGRFRL